MGHAGAWTGLGEGTAESKYRALERVGVTMVDHPAKFGAVMKALLAEPGRSIKKIVGFRTVMFRWWILIMFRGNLQLKPSNDVRTTPIAVRGFQLLSPESLSHLDLFIFRKIKLLISYHPTISKYPQLHPIT